MSAAPGLSKEELDAKAREEQEALMKARAEELAAMQAELDRLAAEARARERGAEQALHAGRQLEGELAGAEAKVKELETSYRVRRRVLDLLPDAAENTAKLQKVGLSPDPRLVSASIPSVFFSFSRPCVRRPPHVHRSQHLNLCSSRTTVRRAS